MMTARGPQVLEFNARFGDPETQAILLRLESDLVEALEACVDGRLAETELRWSRGRLSLRGGQFGRLSRQLQDRLAHHRPGRRRAGSGRAGLPLRHCAGGRPVAHRRRPRAGRDRRRRVAEEALARAYQAMAEIHFEGMYYRRDIGHRALKRKRYEHAGITLQNCWPGTRSRPASGRAISTPTRHLLELPCGIGGTANVQEFVRHIWGVELRWSQRLAGLPVTTREEMPSGPLDALFDLHAKAVAIFSGLLAAPEESWDEPLRSGYGLDCRRKSGAVSRRKVAVHALFHSQRHWAQLATLVRAAGFPSGFKGDLLFSSGAALGSARGVSTSLPCF